MALRLPKLNNPLAPKQPAAILPAPEQSVAPTTARIESGMLAEQLHQLNKRFDGLEAERKRLVSYYDVQLEKLNADRNAINAKLLRFNAILQTEKDKSEDAVRQAKRLSAYEEVLLEKVSTSTISETEIKLGRSNAIPF